MLAFLKQKHNDVACVNDGIVITIGADCNTIFQKDIKLQVIANVIASQSKLAFELGVLNQLPVRFVRLGVFKVNTKRKRFKSVYKYILNQCDGDDIVAKLVIKDLKDKHVFEDIQI